MTIFVNPRAAYLDKLVKCLGLLSSNHDGERLNAVDAALRLLKEHNLTWADIIIGKNILTTVSQGETIEEKIGAILANLEALNTWEKRFIEDQRGRHVFSEKQRAVIERLYRKATAYYAAKRTAA